MTPFRTAIVGGLFIMGGSPLASVGFAGQGKPGGSDAELARMDTNKDGKVSAEEHAAGAKKMFEGMDSNRDAKVSASEMEAAHERVTGRKAAPSDMSAADKIKVVDTDGDGNLTAAEHAGGTHTMFGKMDADRDGFLTRGELAAGHARLLKPRS